MDMHRVFTDVLQSTLYVLCRIYFTLIKVSMIVTYFLAIMELVWKMMQDLRVLVFLALSVTYVNMVGVVVVVVDDDDNDGDNDDLIVYINKCT